MSALQRFRSENLLSVAMDDQWVCWIPTNLGRIHFKFIANENKREFCYTDQRMHEAFSLNYAPNLSDHLKLDGLRFHFLGKSILSISFPDYLKSRVLPEETENASYVILKENDSLERFEGSAHIIHFEKNDFKKLNQLILMCKDREKELFKSFDAGQKFDERDIITYLNDIKSDCRKRVDTLIFGKSSNPVYAASCSFEIEYRGKVVLKDFTFTSGLKQHPFRQEEVQEYMQLLYTIIKRTIHADNHHDKKIDTLLPLQKHFVPLDLLSSLALESKTKEKHVKNARVLFKQDCGKAHGLRTYAKALFNAYIDGTPHEQKGKHILEGIDSVVESIEAVRMRKKIVDTDYGHNLKTSLKMMTAWVLSFTILIVSNVSLYLTAYIHNISANDNNFKLLKIDDGIETAAVQHVGSLSSSIAFKFFVIGILLTFIIPLYNPIKQSFRNAIGGNRYNVYLEIGRLSIVIVFVLTGVTLIYLSNIFNFH